MGSGIFAPHPFPALSQSNLLVSELTVVVVVVVVGRVVVGRVVVVVGRVVVVVVVGRVVVVVGRVVVVVVVGRVVVVVVVGRVVVVVGRVVVVVVVVGRVVVVLLLSLGIKKIAPKTIHTSTTAPTITPINTDFFIILLLLRLPSRVNLVAQIKSALAGANAQKMQAPIATTQMTFLLQKQAYEKGAHIFTKVKRYTYSFEAIFICVVCISYHTFL